MRNHLHDSLYLTVSLVDDLLAKGVQAAILLDSAQYTEAMELANAVVSSDSAEMYGFATNLQAMYSSLTIDTLTWYNLDAEQISYVEELSHQNDREGIQAKCLMELFGGEEYVEPIYPDEEEVIEEEFKQTVTNTNENNMVVVPHPVRDMSSIYISLHEGLVPAHFAIFDVFGRKIMETEMYTDFTNITLNSGELKGGAYFGVVYNPEGLVISKQIIVIH